MPDSMSEMLRRDMRCEGLLDCFHNLKEIDKDVFRLLNEADEPLTVDVIADEIAQEMQRMLNDWYAQMGQLTGEFSEKYGGTSRQTPTVES
ncbi:hypothetical protein [Natrialba aegyptia]|uniref:Transcriptional regulator TrmB n=1 Tax=Natrialba aegyptia DSM 13077 TaxID=1227491 RepID=M0B3A3_9EURY|nr:hypothetical protein [Natrialba aegyptia]ELZ04144.1 transcriptional regulator TrmB [Natrialba aegyptia DSM 13077]